MQAHVQESSKTPALKQYLVCQSQYAEGCGYMLGCGMRYDFIEADSVEAVIEQVVFPDGREENSLFEDDNAPDEILVIPVLGIVAVDVGAMTRAIRQRREREAEETKKAKELAELQRLKAKYGG